MNHLASTLGSFLLLCGFALGPLHAQEDQPKKYDPKKFVTSQQLKQQGTFKIEIPGMGNFEIQDLMLRGDRRANCAVEISSLKLLVKKTVSKGKKLSPGTSLKVSMDKTGCTSPSGEILLCCMNEGSACTVDLGVLQVF